MPRRNVHEQFNDIRSRVATTQSFGNHPPVKGFGQVYHGLLVLDLKHLGVSSAYRQCQPVAERAAGVPP